MRLPEESTYDESCISKLWWLSIYILQQISMNVKNWQTMLVCRFYRQRNIELTTRWFSSASCPQETPWKKQAIENFIGFVSMETSLSDYE